VIEGEWVCFCSSISQYYCHFICNHRFNLSTACCESRSEFKCYFDCLSHCVRGMLPLCQTNPANCEYLICLFPSLYCVLWWLIWFLLQIILQETMSNEHAMRFPFVGSAMLLSLFLLFKFLSKDLVNTVLTGYFFVLGIVALSYVLFLTLDVLVIVSIKSFC